MSKLFNPRSKFIGKGVQQLDRSFTGTGAQHLDRTFAGPRDPGLSDTTGPAFSAEFLTPQVLNGLEAKGYTQDDINSFYNWVDDIDRDAAHQQGFSDEDLFYRFMESLKPQKLQWGQDVLRSMGDARTMTQAPGSDRPMPKGGTYS